MNNCSRVIGECHQKTTNCKKHELATENDRFQPNSGEYYLLDGAHRMNAYEIVKIKIDELGN